MTHLSSKTYHKFTKELLIDSHYQEELIVLGIESSVGELAFLVRDFISDSIPFSPSIKKKLLSSLGKITFYTSQLLHIHSMSLDVSESLAFSAVHLPFKDTLYNYIVSIIKEKTNSLENTCYLNRIVEAVAVMAFALDSSLLEVLQASYLYNIE